MKCINCGRFSFCNKIKDSQQEACEKFIKRKIIITTDSPLIKRNIELDKLDVGGNRVWKYQRL